MFFTYFKMFVFLRAYIELTELLPLLLSHRAPATEMHHA